MTAATIRDVVRETRDRLAEIGVPSKPAVRPPAVLLEAADAEVVAELASYAVRRGFTIKAARQELASRHPHPFKRDTVAAGLTCTECGRSEIFSNHTEEK